MFQRSRRTSKTVKPSQSAQTLLKDTTLGVQHQHEPLPKGNPLGTDKRKLAPKNSKAGEVTGIKILAFKIMKMCLSEEKEEMTNSKKINIKQ